MKEEIFYVHDVYGHIRTCWNYYDLGNFVVKFGSWSFGNSFHDKRWSLKTSRYAFGYSRRYLQEEGEEKLSTVRYVVYDEDYNVVPCQVIDRLYMGTAYLYSIYPISRYKKWRWRIHDNHPGFRNGPVPGTGRGRSKYFRAPRTTQERKTATAHKEFVRGRRSCSNLPDTYDDIIRSDRCDKYSWKKQKKRKQWM